MNARRHGVILASLLGIGALSGISGALVGYRVARQEMRERSNPEAWHERASRRFEQVVQPTPDQTERLARHLDLALDELKGIRSNAAHRSAVVIDRLVEQVEAELTPDQKEAFERIKPRREELMHDVMKVERKDLTTH
jgi:hypothetical protein